MRAQQATHQSAMWALMVCASPLQPFIPVCTYSVPHRPSRSTLLWHLRPLLLQDTDAERAAQRLRLSLADRRYSPTRAIVALVRDLGGTLLTAPAPAAALAPSQANTVSLALADVVDRDLQSRWPDKTHPSIAAIPCLLGWEACCFKDCYSQKHNSVFRTFLHLARYAKFVPLQLLWWGLYAGLYSEDTTST